MKNQINLSSLVIICSFVFSITSCNTNDQKFESNFKIQNSSFIKKLELNKILFLDNSSIDIPIPSITPFKTIFLVTNAETDGTKYNPRLSPDGIKRSQKLAKILSNTSVDAIYTLSNNSTVLTTLPTAQQKKIANNHYQKNQKHELLNKIYTNPNQSNVLIVGQHDNIPLLLNLLYGKKIENLDSLSNNAGFYLVRTKTLGKSVIFSMKY